LAPGENRGGVCYTEETVTKDVVARRYNVSGRVQGVGFRNYVEHVAGKIGVHGYVRNRRDGRVEVFAMGAPEELKELRAELEKGPMMARVDGVSEEPDTVETKYLGNFIIEITLG
jgi:acylphosphatase